MCLSKLTHLDALVTGFRTYNGNSERNKHLDIPVTLNLHLTLNSHAGPWVGTIQLLDELRTY